MQNGRFTTLSWGVSPQILKSFASEVKSDSGEIAANAVERSPEIGGFAVGVVENYGCGVELLREASGAFETQSLSLCTSRDPCKCKVGDKVIVVVESADVAVAAREEHFDDFAFVAL